MAARHQAIAQRGGGAYALLRAKELGVSKALINVAKQSKDSSINQMALDAMEAINDGGESFLRVHWVAVPQALRARRVNRCKASMTATCCGARSTISTTPGPPIRGGLLSTLARSS